MTEAINPSELKLADGRRRASRRSGACRDSNGLSSLTAVPVGPDAQTGVAAHGELERLYFSLSAVTPENHPRTARLLAASTRKAAQKVIEEAGEVALEAVKHHSRGIVRESADLLYHLVALWHRAGVDPDFVWIEMRRRAEELGIAEKPPKARHRASAVILAPKGGDNDGQK